MTGPRSATFLGVGDLAVAWNEETVFRGSGFETVREALGHGKAVVVLIPGFALYHSLDPQQILGMLAGGAMLMLLRLHSDGLWLPVGYHWTWNVLQTASLARQTPRPPSGRSRCMAPNAGGRPGALNQGCSVRSFSWRWRCSCGCGSKP